MSNIYEMRGEHNNGCRFKHDDSVVISTHISVADNHMHILSDASHATHTVNPNSELGMVRMSNQPWPDKIKADPITELLPDHAEGLVLSAMTPDRPDDKIMTLDLTAPVIMLNSMYSEAANFKYQAGQLIEDYGIVYGEPLVDLLKWILDTLKNHTHPPSSPPTIPVKAFTPLGDLDTRREYIDTIGSKYNILNYYVRSK